MRGEALAIVAGGNQGLHGLVVFISEGSVPAVCAQMHARGAWDQATAVGDHVPFVAAGPGVRCEGVGGVWGDRVGVPSGDDAEFVGGAWYGVRKCAGHPLYAVRW